MFWSYMQLQYILQLAPEYLMVFNQWSSEVSAYNQHLVTPTEWALSGRSSDIYSHLESNFGCTSRVGTEWATITYINLHLQSTFFYSNRVSTEWVIIRFFFSPTINIWSHQQSGHWVGDHWVYIFPHTLNICCVGSASSAGCILILYVCVYTTHHHNDCLSSVIGGHVDNDKEERIIIEFKLWPIDLWTFPHHRFHCSHAVIDWGQ
jgi:hypothetical protein